MHNRTGAPRRGRRGLTLIEILVVVTILGILASIVGLDLMGRLKDAERDAASVQLDQLSDAIALFRVKFGRLPTNPEGLNALAHPPGGGRSLLQTSEVPVDPWGAEYQYEIKAERHPPFQLRSKGPDGVEGTEDDVLHPKN